MMHRIRSVLSRNNARAAMTRGAFRLADERTVPYATIHRSRQHVAATLVSLLTMGSVFAIPAVAQDRQSLQHPASLRGTVINALTGEPIGRALVYTPDNRFARFTDGEGHFDYPLPKSSPDDAIPLGIQRQSQSQFMLCCIQARKPGFLSQTGQEQGTQLSLDTEPVIALIPEGLIEGRVTLPSSDAAPGMMVELFSRQVQDGAFHWVRGQAFQTNSNGEFRFAELPPGEYKIVSRELMDTDPSALFSERQLHGFPPVYFPGTVDFTSASPIPLKAGQTFEADLSPVRQAYYPVRIPVADDVENGAVTVSIQGHDSPGYSLGFRPDRHSIDGFLPNGTYQVSMQTFQPNPTSGTVTLTVSGGPAQGSRMVLSRQSSIRLKVTEEFTSRDDNRSIILTSGNHRFDGQRLYLQASLEPINDLSLAGGRSIRPPTGPDDDTLVIDNVAPGSYHLRPFAGRGYVASAAAGGVDLLQEPLVVSSGSTPTIDIHLRDDFAEVDGSLAKTIAALNPSAKPDNRASWQPAAYVYFVPQPGGTGQFQEVGTDSEGKFQLPNIVPGKYLVLAFEKQQMNLPYRDIEAMRIYEPKGQTLRLAAGQKEKLELQIVSSNE